MRTEEPSGNSRCIHPTRYQFTPILSLYTNQKPPTQLQSGRTRRYFKGDPTSVSAECCSTGFHPTQRKIFLWVAMHSVESIKTTPEQGEFNSTEQVDAPSPFAGYAAAVAPTQTVVETENFFFFRANASPPRLRSACRHTGIS